MCVRERVCISYMMGRRAVSNVHKKKKQYREAEGVLLLGIAATMRSAEAHEHPFWYKLPEREHRSSR